MSEESWYDGKILFRYTVTVVYGCTRIAGMRQWMTVNKGEVYQSRKEKSILRIFCYKKERFIFR